MTKFIIGLSSMVLGLGLVTGQETPPVGSGGAGGAGGVPPSFDGSVDELWIQELRPDPADPLNRWGAKGWGIFSGSVDAGFPNAVEFHYAVGLLRRDWNGIAWTFQGQGDTVDQRTVAPGDDFVADLSHGWKYGQNNQKWIGTGMIYTLEWDPVLATFMLAILDQDQTDVEVVGSQDDDSDDDGGW